MVVPICFVCATYPGNYGLHCFALHHWCIVRCDDTKPCGSEHRLCAWLVRASLVKKEDAAHTPASPVCPLLAHGGGTRFCRPPPGGCPPTHPRDADGPWPLPRTSGQRVWSGTPRLPRVRRGGGDESWGHHTVFMARAGGVVLGAHEAARRAACQRACRQGGGWRRGQPAWPPTPRRRRGPALLRAQRS